MNLNNEREDKTRKDSSQILCYCGVSRWYHPVYEPVEFLRESTNHKDFIHRYCKSTQKQLKINYPDAYKTTNGLCVDCLTKGICCFFSDHPSGEEVITPVYLEQSKVSSNDFLFSLIEYLVHNEITKHKN